MYRICVQVLVEFPSALIIFLPNFLADISRLSPSSPAAISETGVVSFALSKYLKET